ncbi:hypothetical protein C8R44DRAFT_732790 [Mycena epipterygia]|nr:hypothetical protein C8R44DRAFT_732790 [Mycena epipterygia]
MPLLPRWRGKACKVVILAQFDHRYYIHGTLKRLTDVVAWLKAWWICVFWLGSRLSGSVEEMLPKIMILAQFGHGYYIRGILKRLTDVVALLKAWWICVSVKQVTDQKSMPSLPRWGGKVVKLAQFGHRYYICGTLKWLTVTDQKSMPCCIAGEEIPMILAQSGHGYYIRGTLKWPTGVLAWLKAWWIYEVPAKVVILAQFGYGYYIRGTLKRLTEVVAWLNTWWIPILYLWDFEVADGCFGLAQGFVDLCVLACLKAWWICVSVKQVTAQKSMPPLPHWRGKVVNLAQFGHGYYIRGALTRLTDVVA